MRDGQVLSPDETISVNEALKAMTIYPAWQSFRDKEIGSIATGKYADFVILAKNPKKVNPTEIGSIPVVETWLEGRRVLQETSH
jgi:predicted amidohydrolase YtcJ